MMHNTDATGHVLSLVQAERERQIKKWGVQDRKPLEWLAILGEEFGEVSQVLCEVYCNDNHGHSQFGEFKQQEYLDELIQVAAVATAAAENIIHGRA